MCFFCFDVFIYWEMQSLCVTRFYYVGTKNYIM